MCIDTLYVRLSIFPVFFFALANKIRDSLIDLSLDEEIMPYMVSILRENPSISSRFIIDFNLVDVIYEYLPVCDYQ